MNLIIAELWEIAKIFSGRCLNRSEKYKPQTRSLENSDTS